MFNITRRDIAWGTGIASVIATAAFIFILSNLVNSTAKVTANGMRAGVYVARGVIAAGFVPATRSYDDPEQAEDLANVALDEETSRKVLAQGK
ncbi:MAG: hypothetical protein KA066_01150 [Candidatus Pacebacteria bacterium]|nr:hypothetical protein [Candidatus Paceibacterota bacterium]